MKVTRIQRSRAKGAKLPPRTVCVGRGSNWGNPFRVVEKKIGGKLLFPIVVVGDNPRARLLKYEHYKEGARTKTEALAEATRLHRLYREALETKTEQLLEALRRRHPQHLACWCSLDSPCHADYWIERMNEAK